MSETATPTVSFKRGDRVRYIGPNAFYGLLGCVRGVGEPWAEENKIDVDLDLGTRRGKRRTVRKIVAPENLEMIGVPA